MHCCPKQQGILCSPMTVDPTILGILKARRNTIEPPIIWFWHFNTSVGQEQFTISWSSWGVGFSTQVFQPVCLESARQTKFLEFSHAPKKHKFRFPGSLNLSASVWGIHFFLTEDQGLPIKNLWHSGDDTAGPNGGILGLMNVRNFAAEAEEFCRTMMGWWYGNGS